MQDGRWMQLHCLRLLNDRMIALHTDVNNYKIVERLDC